MRWATYRPANQAKDDVRVGVVEGDALFGLESGVRLIDLLGDDGERLSRAGERARRDPADVSPLAQAILLPPIPQPPTVRDSSSFEDHHLSAVAFHKRSGINRVAADGSDSWYELPTFYFGNANGLIGHDAEIIAPHYSRELDFELEVCAVVGREGRNLDPVEAEKHIAGYTIFNDWSARDLQRDETARSPVGPAKGKDFGISLGPFLVTPDELEDRRKDHGFDLKMTSWVNGQPYSSGNWASVHWSFGELLSFASRNVRLAPGDVMAAGTVGTGCILELSGLHGSERYPWLKAGDEVVLEIERLGRLRNRVAIDTPIAPIRGRVGGGRVGAG
jgi:2-keto-4-pentenoate hydratase/2-oxohepta-3-ene-1,7-dioic acid hydratase in catechol pathway